MIPENKSLNELLFDRFVNGDELAFEHIFKEKFNQIAGFCDQFVSHHDDARNITQEAFLNLWLNRKKIKKQSGIDSFLYTYAKSGCLNHIRHAGVVNRYAEHSLNIAEQQLNIDILHSLNFDSVEIKELQRKINQAIESLPEKCRKVFKLKRFEGKMNKEVATQLGITVKSVEANMTRALKLLKEDLAEYLPVALFLLFLQSLN